MQQPSRHLFSAAFVVLAMVGALFATASPASAAPPAQPTVHMEDGGDGFLNAQEISDGVFVTGTYDTAASPPITRINVNVRNDASCDESSTWLENLDATLNPDGTYVAGPFDLSDDSVFAQDAAVCTRARAHNSDGFSDPVSISDNTPVKDTIAPSGTVFLDDGDGYVNAAELDDNLPALWETTAADAETRSVWFEQDDGTIPSGCGPFNGTNVTDEGFLNETCANNLAEGPFAFVGTFTDAAGNVSDEASDASIKDSLVPARGLLTYEDTDGFLTEDELDAEFEVAWEDLSEGDATYAEVWFQQRNGVIPDGCGKFTVDPTGVGALNTTCAHNLAEGRFFVRAQWFDDAANASTIRSIRITKDTIPPTATISLGDDGDGLILPDEQASGLPVTWEVTENGDPVTVIANNVGAAAPEECTFTDQPRSATGAIPSTCFDVLDGGDIEVSVEGADLAGHEVSATDGPYFLKKSVGSFVVRALDESADGAYIPDIANIEETEGGTAFKVRVDLDPSTVHNSVSATITVRDVDGNSLTQTKIFNANSNEAKRTFTFDVTGFTEDEVTIEATISDSFGFVDTATDTTVLDLSAPQLEWTTEDGAQMFRLKNPIDFITFGCCTGSMGSLEGTASDTAHDIQWVYLKGRNLSNGTNFGKHASRSDKQSTVISWSHGINHMSPGEWRVTATTQDEAGNISAPQTITVFVDGT